MSSRSPSGSEPARSISHVHSFLRSCEPPLEHLLPRFFDLGFHSQGLLQVVACKWTTEERRELLRRLAPGPNGEMTVTELELAALDRAFDALRSASTV
jgi:hypothetical protein